MTSVTNKNEIKSQNIYQRLNKVMLEVTYIKKREKKSGMQYSFVSHDDVSSLLHMPLASNGIMPITNVLSYTVDGTKHSLRLAMTFINIDNPEDKVTVEGHSCCFSNDDKGYGKAMSYAVKYIFLKTFVLESGDEDEMDADQGKKVSNIKETINDDQIKQLIKMIGLDTEAKEKILSRFKTEKFSDIPKDDFSKIVVYLETRAKEKADGKARVA